jgi:hypothetical protein
MIPNKKTAINEDFIIRLILCLCLLAGTLTYAIYKLVELDHKNEMERLGLRERISNHGQR